MAIFVTFVDKLGYTPSALQAILCVEGILSFKINVLG
jgi:hypothetical protein